MPSLFCLSISTESIDNLVSEMKETQNPITQHSAQFKNLIMNPNTPSAELLKVKAGLDAKITTLKKMNTMLEELIKKQTPPEQTPPEQDYPEQTPSEQALPEKGGKNITRTTLQKTGAKKAPAQQKGTLPTPVAKEKKKNNPRVVGIFRITG